MRAARAEKAVTRTERTDGPLGEVLVRPNGVVCIPHARVTTELDQPPGIVFDVLSRFDDYERWSDQQGPAEWLTSPDNGAGSEFVLYDRIAGWHLMHRGCVIEASRPTAFRWSAPFGEWPRATIGSTTSIEPADEGSAVTETFWFEVDDTAELALRGFLNTPRLDRAAFTTFLEARWRGLAALLRDGDVPSASGGSPPLELPAADWAGRIATDGWVRVLYADKRIQFDAPPEPVFNVLCGFHRYRDWTPDIHVGAVWLRKRAGGLGSRVLIWEKPGRRQVMHDAVVTEFEPSQRFTWRAPFAEWGKVFIGTSLTLEPAPNGTSHAYHVLYVDVPEEYFALFTGFGTLHGFDLQFETWHIDVEARGVNDLLVSGAFSDAELADPFTTDVDLAEAWPLQDGRRWPEATATLVPERTISFEQMLVETAHLTARSVPSAAFFRQHRDLAQMQRYNPEME